MGFINLIIFQFIVYLTIRLRHFNIMIDGMLESLYSIISIFMIFEEKFSLG